MKRLGLVGVAVVAVLLSDSAVVAQTTLRIGLAEDPDVLDPTLARTYVGRIVFASLCDKLFDIDENLNIVPQLALSHDTSADGKTVTVKLRPGVKFHDGEMMDAEAVKASLERHMTMQGSNTRNPPSLRAPNGVLEDSFYQATGRPLWNASSIYVPTLLVAGAYDTWSFAEDREGLLRDLVHAPAKRSVLIPDATHFVLFEKNRLQFFEEVLNFVKQ